MGSLSSRPKVPSQPQVVYVPTTPASAPAAVPSTSSEAQDQVNENTAQEHEKTLLRRNRGRFGTIQTSFRGLLSSAQKSEQKKTLLGE